MGAGIGCLLLGVVLAGTSCTETEIYYQKIQKRDLSNTATWTIGFVLYNSQNRVHSSGELPY